MEEAIRRLTGLLAGLPPPPDPHGLYPRYAELKEKLVASVGTADTEESFLALYSHVHGYEVPFTPEERARFRELDGYLCHVGGLSPLVKAEPFITPDTVSGDFGAGNGLQGLLLQYLYPHRRTVQVELSSRLVESGRLLQEWIGIPGDRVEWIAGDITDVSPADMDFVYLYRPVRPDGPGRAFYEKFAAELDRAKPSVVVFSVADCLGPFLSSKFEAFDTDGHLTCFRRTA
ncbi:MAG: hypothetical protein ACYTAF_13470 [Planctomycetota bacterium]|jgi:hypothetical protein